MKTLHHYMGIDTSKGKLDCCITSDGKRRETNLFDNDTLGVEELLKWLGPRTLDTRVVVEATSRYHRDVSRSLESAGATVLLLNPKRARSLADGFGHLDKDDKTDAWVLARSALKLDDSERTALSETHQDLRDFSRAIDQLKREAAEMKKRCEGLGHESPAYTVFQDAAKLLEKRARQAETEFKQLIKGQTELNRRYTLANTVPCIGHVTARIIAVEMPADLDQFSIRDLCAYSGLAPRKNESGNRKPPPKIKKSCNLKIRTGTYMAATQAALLRKTHAEFYDRLVQKGLHHTQAIIAVIHKLIRTVLAVIKRNTAWTPQPPDWKKAKQAIQVEQGVDF